MRSPFALLLALVLAGMPLLAQSLAEIARKEAERRKRVPGAGKVYTNRDLKEVPPGSSPSPRPAKPDPTAAAAGAGEGATAAVPGAAPGDKAPAAEEAEARAEDEQQWRARMSEARTQLERSRMFAEALQSRINGLYADFVARDDPAQRAVIERERQKAVAELERVRSEVQAQTRALADLEEEARRAGVPPGWLR